MSSSGRDAPRSSAHGTRRTLPVPVPGTTDDHAAPPPATDAASQPGAPVASTNNAELSAAVGVPRGLQVAAAWSWRVILVVALIWGIFWVVQYLSEVFIPIAVAILLTAL